MLNILGRKLGGHPRADLDVVETNKTLASYVNRTPTL
jgi:hypothetical protein